mgnify:CR=1 FL=1
MLPILGIPFFSLILDLFDKTRDFFIVKHGLVDASGFWSDWDDDFLLYFKFFIRNDYCLCLSI